MSKLKIGDLFELEKGELQSSKCTEGQYDFITAAEEWKTHNTYSHEMEALIFAAMASGSLGRAHYVNGKFITSDLCYILTPKDAEKYPIDLKFYHFVFNSLRDEIVKNTKSGTSKESINQRNLKNYKIPYFDIEQQHFWIEKLLNTKAIKEELEDNINHQQQLLKKLRQSILQDAIEGNLTASWREQNPTAESVLRLLEKIKAEKDQLIKEKKIKRQQPLPAISIDEIPFNIPNSWEWCRLENITSKITDGEHQTPPRITKGRKLLSAKNIRNGFIDFNNVEYISEENYQKSINRCHPQQGDILIVSVGATIGRSSVLKENIDFALVRSVALIQPLGINSDFLKIILDSDIFQKDIQKKSWGSAQPCLYLNKIKLISIPIPSKDEQKEIVKKVENLFTLCDELEEQMNSSKTNTKTLMQAVLKEAFER